MPSVNIIRAVIIFVIGSIIALFLGMGIATDQAQTLLKFAAVGTLLFCAMLGHRIWLLMVVLSALNIPLIRGFSTPQLGQFLFLGFGTLLFLMRRLNVRFNLGEIEWWRLLLGLCIVQVYLRNPVGLNMFGAGNVGGKAYFLCALAFVTSWIYGSLKVEPKELKWAMNLSILVSFIGIPVGEIRTRSGLAAIEASEVGSQQAALDEGAATRNGLLGGIGVTLSRWIASMVHPLKACFHPLWAPLILISLACAAGSGYRNTIAIVGLTYLVALAYRGGWPSVILASMMGVLGIASLSIINMIAPLPPNAQRALTAFPGTWEQRYKDDAKGSSEWRYEMWEEALLTDRWIANKWFGDGLGMSALELERAANIESRKAHQSISGISVHQENAMASGDYHSGPVQSVRIVGYVGLIVLLAAMIRNAVHAHRMVMRCKGTEWYNWSLYFAIPTIAAPIIFTFVFGDFGRAAAGVFMGGAFLSLIRNSLPLPEYRKVRHQPFILSQHNNNNNTPSHQRA
jgi:hypothetical protein